MNHLHHPAPWNMKIQDGMKHGINRQFTPEAIITVNRFHHIATVKLACVGYSGTADDRAQDEATARLIQKSPELLTRLEDLTNALHSILDGIDSGANSLMTDDGDPQPVNLDHARHALLQAQELLKGL